MASVREWDEESSYRNERHSRPVTVRRYKISDPDDHADDQWDTSSRYSRRDAEARTRSRSRETTREIRIERKHVSRSPSPEVREWRIQRDVSRDPPHRDDYDLDRYTRSTEYFERERPERHRHHEPQTIIIKNEAPTPIIIRERESVQGKELAVRDSPSPEPTEEKKEEKLEVQASRSHRSASVDDRQTARRDTSPDEDYYYQRTTREIARRPAPRDDYDDYNRTRRRTDNDNYSDDDIYYRRTEYVDPDEHTIHDPNHRRHLLEGAVVGLGTAALLNRDRKKKGEKSGGAGTLLGGAAVGAAGTELYSRARQHWARSRSRSGEYEYSSRGRRHWDDDDGGPRERSSSRGLPGGNLAKLGAVAVVGALAGYAASRAGGKNKKDNRRSRSRRRRHSRGASRSRSSSIEGAPSASKRNSTIAGAGLASAAVAGLVEHQRNKSRPGRSKSRLRTGLPIAAAGLGGAALAGLYENSKAKKAKAEARARSLSRSPSRARSRSVGAGEHAKDVTSDRRLIEYGDDPISPEYDRPRSRADSYYSDYGRRRGSPSSAESSPRRRRDHSRGVEDAAAGAGVAGIAAHEASKRRERKRAERERRRQEEERNDAPQQTAGYEFGPYAQEPPPPPPMGTVPPQMQYGNQFYPQTNNFAPPPANAYSPAPNFASQGHTQEYAHPQPQYAPQPPQTSTEPYAFSAAPAPAEHYETNDARLQQTGPHVSHTSPATSVTNDPVEQADVETARPRLARSVSSGAVSPLDTTSTNRPHSPVERRVSRVRFNLQPETRTTSEGSGIHHAIMQSVAATERRPNGRRATVTGEALSTSRRLGHGRWLERSSSPASDGSGDTVDLPDRFDELGHRKRERGEDLLADALEDMFRGRGTAGNLLQRFAGSLAGGTRFTGRRRSE